MSGTQDVVYDLDMAQLSAMTARLAEILAEEADLLADMKIRDIEPLQHEKILLTRALEVQLKRLRKHPELLDEADPEDVEEFRELAGLFDQIKDENFRRLEAAREVNQQVVEAIRQVVSEQSRKPTYSDSGNPEQQVDIFSVTLNKTI